MRYFRRDGETCGTDGKNCSETTGRGLKVAVTKRAGANLVTFTVELAISF
jgi:hypothetical protein